MANATGTLTEFAAHLGCSGAYVTKLKKQGRLVMVSVDGKEMVDFELSARLIRNTTDPAKADNGANAKPGAGSRLVQEVGVGNKLDLTFKQARTHEAAYRAKLTELEFKEREGGLTEVEKVTSGGVTLAAMARSAFEKIPDKLADRLAVEADPAACHALVLAEIDQVLADFSAGCRQFAQDIQDGRG